jgi:hypothetical protein
MGRPAKFSPDELAALRESVLKHKFTPKEIKEVFGVSLQTAYRLIRDLNLPIFKEDDALKFYDPSWRLRPAPTPAGISEKAWGPWYHTDSIPPGAHRSIFKHIILPKSALIVAQYITRKLPNLSVPCIRFRDGNSNNVTLENIEHVETDHATLAREARRKYLAELSADDLLARKP